jgi:hypothetical protein
MSFDSDSIAENIENGVTMLMAMARGEEATADQMERQLFQGLLALGRELMQLFFTTRSEAEQAERQRDAGGKPYVGQKTRAYLSIFGEVEVERGYNWRKGQSGEHPLDEALSLPGRKYSDWVQEMVGELSVLKPEGEAVGVLARWFGWQVPKRSAQQVLADHAAEVAAYYEQRETPTVGEHDRILVALADGKGIPMNREHSPPPQARRGRGERKTAKKEAIVTATYTIAPYVRSAADIIEALLPAEPAADKTQQRPKPSGKQVFGTLAGKATALTHLAQQVAKRDSPQLRDRVVLTDGAISLQRQVEKHLPDFTLVLDIMHVMQYLWDAAHALLGETHPNREPWMRKALRAVLEDDLDTLLAQLDAHLEKPTLSKRKRKTLTTVVNYLRKNRPYMDYQSYLAWGWPIGTGVVEGACQHLVRDRFELSGMRWSMTGAEVMLALRAVYLNGDWDDFQRFRRFRVHQRRYGTSHPHRLPELVILNAAA